MKAPRGTYDVLPEQAAERRALEEAARTVLERAGYRRVETPAFEATELFARGVGASTDVVQKEMFTFTDRGERSLTLRPEGTAPICRAYLEHGMHKLPQPVKLWYLSSFFRYERAQAGRFRQFWQVGAEAIGSDDPAVDAELIVLLHTVLEDVGVQGLRLRLSSLGTAATRARYRERLAAHLRAHAEELSEEVRARIDLNPLRAFDADHPGTQRVMATAPRLLDELDPADAEHFAAVRALLELADLDHEVDPTLVRGLDYYARTVFEFTSDVLGAQSAVGGGGRYDGLIEQLGGSPTPGCGWAAGIERIVLAIGDARVPEPRVELYVGYDDAGSRPAAFAVGVAARRAGMTAQVELAGRSPKGQRKQADRVGARWLAVLDEDGATLRDMDTGDEVEVPAEGIVARALREGGRG